MKIVSQPSNQTRMEFIAYKFLLNSNLLNIHIIQLVPKIIVSHFCSAGNFGLEFHLKLFAQPSTKVPWKFDNFF